MFGSRNTLRIGALLGAILLPLPLAAGTVSAAPLKKAKQQSVEGTIRWTVWTTYRDEGDPQSGSSTDETTEENFSLKVDAVRDPSFTRTYVFKRSKAPFSYTYASTRVTRDRSFGQVTCETTTQANASGGESVDVTPKIFGRYNPNRDVLVIDRRTKGISLYAFGSASGTSTTVQKGFGLSPCQEGSWTDPIEQGGGTTLNNANWRCLPNGLKKVSRGENPLFGTWNKKKKRFDFRCTRTFSDTGGTTQKITINGSLKYRR
jgi:hypothetical protein